MIVKVVNTVTHIVDRLPADVFEEAAPPSPPSAFSPHDSFDSMGPDIPAIPTPANGPDAERNNIIRELVETERKYVQDLEVMQVRTSSFQYCSPFELSGAEICPRIVTKQHPRPRYNPPTLSQPQ